MAISLVGINTSATTTVTIPAHVSGDLLVMFAYRATSSTALTMPTGWTDYSSGSTASPAAHSNRLAYRQATASGTTSGTWTNANGLCVMVFRGVDLNLTMALAATQSATGTGGTVTLPALTGLGSNGGSWFMFNWSHRTTTSFTDPGSVEEYQVFGTTGRGAVAMVKNANSVTSRTSTPSASSGWRSISWELRPTSPPTAPGAPTSLSATAGTGEATLNWTAPASDGGDAITRYEYRQSTNAGSSWGSWTTTGATATSHVVTGLTNGQAYVFQVRAVNDFGNSAESNTSNSVTPVALPKTEDLTDTFTTSIDSAKWASYGTVAIESGRLKHTSGAGTYDGIQTLGKQNYDLTSSYMLAEVELPTSGLHASWEYHFEFIVDANNLVSMFWGSGNLHYRYKKAGVNTQASLGAFNATNHKWWRIRESGGTLYYETSPTGLAASWTTQHSFTHGMTLTSGYYNITSGAWDGAAPAFSAYLDNLNNAPTVTAPGAPTSLTATSGNTQATLNWTAPASDGGSAITDYEYRSSTNAGSSWGSWTSTGSTTNSYVVTGLTNGQSYVFQVRAVNAVGSGTESNTSNSVTPSGVVKSAWSDWVTATQWGYSAWSAWVETELFAEPLVLDDARSESRSTDVLLAQESTLVVDSARSSSAASTPELSHETALLVDSARSEATATSPELGLASSLDVVDARAEGRSSTPELSQSTTLVGQAARSAARADVALLAQEHAALLIDGSRSESRATTPSLGQSLGLTVDSARSEATATSPLLAQETELAMGGAVRSEATADTVLVEQTSALVVDDARSEAQADEALLPTHFVLVVDGARSEVRSDEVLVAQSADLIMVGRVRSEATAEVVLIEQISALGTDDVRAESRADAPYVGSLFVAAESVRSESSASTPRLVQNIDFAIGDGARATASATRPVITQHSTLVVTQARSVGRATRPRVTRHIPISDVLDARSEARAGVPTLLAAWLLDIAGARAPTRATRLLLGVELPAPAHERTYVVPPESRLTVVKAESRTNTVEAMPRTDVLNESRVLVIASEARTTTA